MAEKIYESQIKTAINNIDQSFKNADSKFLEMKSNLTGSIGDIATELRSSNTSDGGKVLADRIEAIVESIDDFQNQFTTFSALSNITYHPAHRPTGNQKTETRRID